MTKSYLIRRLAQLAVTATVRNDGPASTSVMLRLQTSKAFTVLHTSAGTCAIETASGVRCTVTLHDRQRSRAQPSLN